MATYRPRLPGSAALEPLEPATNEGPVARHRARYGAGAYRISLRVIGFGAAGDRLTDRGLTYFQDADAGESRIRIDPERESEKRRATT